MATERTEGSGRITTSDSDTVTGDGSGTMTTNSKTVKTVSPGEKASKSPEEATTQGSSTVKPENPCSAIREGIYEFLINISI